jgi:hypothetical protein
MMTTLAILHAFRAGLIEHFHGLKQRGIELRVTPDGRDGGETLDRIRGALVGRLRLPVVESEQRANGAVERDHRDLVGRRSGAGECFHFLPRIVPELLPTHARARVHEDHAAFAGAGRRNGRRRTR